MIEYLYDSIVAVSGQPFTVYAVITDDEDQIIETGCSMVIHSDDAELVKVDGEYLPDNLMWGFTFPADATVGLVGRYWYDIRHDDSNLCFKQPIYFKN